MRPRPPTLLMHISHQPFQLPKIHMKLPVECVGKALGNIKPEADSSDALCRARTLHCVPQHAGTVVQCSRSPALVDTRRSPNPPADRLRPGAVGHYRPVEPDSQLPRSPRSALLGNAQKL
jgi:hypothetical protein